MKATLLRVTVVLAMVMAFTAVSAYGQGDHSTVFVIPFEFRAGDKVLPAGEYRVSSGSQLVRIESKDGKRVAIALSFRTKSSEQMKLTFRRSGDNYQLSKIWLADGVGRELQQPKNVNSDVSQIVSVVDIVSGNR